MRREHDGRDGIVIEPRFCGPPGAGNGGYACGLLAARAEGPLAVTLRAPVPLGRRLRVEAGGGGGRRVLRDGETLLAEAEPAPAPDAPPAPIPFEHAAAVAGSCRAFETHPFPRCFVCGPERRDDGLCIFPGWIDELALVAAPWIPAPDLADGSGRVRPEILWAALDCPTSFPLLEGEPRLREPAVLGRLRAHVPGTVRAGERCVVIAWARALEGRKGVAGAALYDASGGLAGASEATWISLAGRPEKVAAAGAPTRS